MDMENSNLNTIFDNLDSFNDLVSSRFEKGDETSDYSDVVLMASIQCEIVLKKILENEGLCVDNNGFIDVSDDKRFPHSQRLSYLAYAAMSPNLLPAEMRRIIDFIRRNRNEAAHSRKMSRIQAKHFIQAFNAFATWYYIHYGEYKKDQNSHLQTFAGLIDLNIKRERYNGEQYSEESLEKMEKETISIAGISMDRLEEIVARVVREEVHNGVAETVNVIKTEAGEIKDKIDELSELVISLSEKIGDYQSLVEKQLKMATSDEEKEHIIHTFSEECVSKMEARFEKKEADKNFRRNLNGLKETLGEACWNRLEARSRTFLISSRIMYDELIILEDVIDYSGVCLLVTKALEYELSKRFCKMFLKYLKEQYGKDYSKYPSTMLRDFDGVTSTINKEDFTLGSVAYILCIRPKLNPDDDTTQRDKDKAILLDFAEKKLYRNKSRTEIEVQLDSYAEDIEDIKTRFRNRAAHTNELKKKNAKECFDIVLDVQKLLKKMIESFDNTESS